MFGRTHATACSGVSPAVASAGVLVTDSSFVDTSLFERGSREADFESNPIPPPPRA